jgi:hypothetical protein
LRCFCGWSPSHFACGNVMTFLQNATARLGRFAWKP